MKSISRLFIFRRKRSDNISFTSLVSQGCPRTLPILFLTNEAACQAVN